MREDATLLHPADAPPVEGASGAHPQEPTDPPRPGWSVTRLPTVERSAYVVAAEFAKGGIGRILRARDTRLDRPVALKELLDPYGEDAPRFVREALITARLQHPSIVPIYEAGFWPSGEPFYAMKLVSGRPLDALIDERPTLAERLALLPHVLAAVEAVAYAHSERIIHRDLKPGNVLVGAFGETVVIDWGLAKDLDDGAPEPPPTAPAREQSVAPFPGLTVHGAVMGTPMFMPREQAMGLAVGERADVYALGAILYHVLAGAPPYALADAHTVLRRVIAGPPPPVEERQSGIPEDLSTIVRKAMAREPLARYPTARELAEDLRRFQTGQIVAAHRYSPGERARRFARRNRGALTVAGAALILSALGGVLGVRSLVAERDRVDDRANELTLVQARASVAVDPNKTITLLRLLSRRFTGMRTARMIAADARAHRLARVLHGHTMALNDLLFSPGGDLLATTSDDHQIRLWDLRTGEGRVLAGHTDEVWTVFFSPDGKTLASSSKDGTVRVWSLAEGTSTALGGGGNEIRVTRFSPDGKLLAVAYRDSALWIWDLATGKRRVPVGHNDDSRRFAFSPSGARLASSSNDGTVRLWDVVTGEARIFEAQGAGVPFGVAFSPDGKLVASACTGRAVWVWDVETGAGRRLGDATGALQMVAFSPDGTKLVAMGAAGAASVWDMKTFAARSLQGHEGGITSLAFSPDGRYLASSSTDRTVRLWDMALEEVEVLRGFEDVVHQVTFSPDGEILAAASWDHTTRLFRVRSPERRRLVGHTATVNDAVFSPDDEQLASASGDGTVRLWGLREEGARVLEGHQGSVTRVLFSPDRRWVASASRDGTVRLWDRQGAPGPIFAERDGPVTTIAFSPDGRQVASASEDGTVRVRDVAGGESRVLPGRPPAITSLVFSPDGERLASSGRYSTVWMWNVASGRGEAFANHDGKVLAIAFAPGGGLFATGGADHTLRIWDPAQREIRRISAGGIGVHQLAFTPDQRTVISLSAGWETGVRLWDAETGQRRDILTGHAAAVSRFALSQDGSRLVTVSEDHSVRLWDVAARESRLLQGHEGEIRAVSFSSDGKWIAAAGADHTVQLWLDDLPTEPAALRAWVERAEIDPIEPPLP